MALKITKASEAITVDRVVVNIYGGPGLGKTSLGYTADAPLLLDFDGGAYRSGNRGDTVRVESWAEVAAITPADLAGYRTVVVDTVGRALDHLSAVLIADDPKMGRRDGSLSLQGFGALKASFASWLLRLKQSGLDVVLIAHMSEQKKGDEIIERLDVQGSSKEEIHKSGDAMARLYMENGRRILNFSPTDVGFGKNPAGFEPLAVPDFAVEPHFLAGIVERIKTKLNEESEAQRVEREKLAEIRAGFEKLETPEEFTAESAELAKAEPRVKRMLLDVAAEKGFEFDAKAKAFRSAKAA